MLEFPVTSMRNRFLSIYDTTFSSVQWPRRQMPVEPKYFTSVHRRSLSNKVSHATQDPKTSVWQCDTLPRHQCDILPCKYSVQRFDHSHATRLQQFNTNYFHLTGAAIKTVSPSDWDSCLCAARFVTERGLRTITSTLLFSTLCALRFSLPPLCFPPPLLSTALDAPITPKCSLANFPPDRQTSVVIRRVCRANWDLLRWDGCN